MQKDKFAPSGATMRVVADTHGLLRPEATADRSRDNFQTGSKTCQYILHMREI